jgi:hypothetical protein
MLRGAMITKFVTGRLNFVRLPQVRCGSPWFT